MIADLSCAGLDMPRLTGKEYYEIVDEFIRSVLFRYPHVGLQFTCLFFVMFPYIIAYSCFKVLIQFEDFQNAHARTILEHYRKQVKCFNDDIQGRVKLQIVTQCYHLT